MKLYKEKELIVFDLDGTLAKTKSSLEPDMARALTALLAQKKVAIISGGTFTQFKKQVIDALDCPKPLLANLFLFPTTGTSFYRYAKGWKKVYSFELSKKERAAIKTGFREALKEIGYVAPKKVYGKVIEDRRSQVTFSALGQDVVAMLGKKGVRLKEEWTRKNTPVKLKIAKLMGERLPMLEVHASGFTSIDVTRKGIDKEYGIHQMKKYLHIPISKMLFVGDALYPGGNDYAAKRSGVKTFAVKGPEETKKLILNIVSARSR